jgi:predicted membrane chloride channel (bestrophin family)
MLTASRTRRRRRRLTLASAEPQGLTSFALSLLLVFRTNSSYGRFDEARKVKACASRTLPHCSHGHA